MHRELTRLRRVAFLAGVLAALAGLSRAETLPVRTYTSVDGLPSNQAEGVFADSQGFLWVVTPDGLSRFDGHDFVNLGVEDGLPPEGVTDLLETRSGTMWVSTWSGLYRFDRSAGPFASAFTRCGTERGVTQAGPDNRPLWSPDGTKIAFSSAMAQPFYYYTNSHLALIPAAGGSITDLTKTFDENPGPIDWLKGGIFFSASKKTAAHLFLLDPATQAVKKITPWEDRIVSGVSLAEGPGAIAFIRTGPKEFPDVWVVSAMTGALKKVTDLGAQVASWPQPSQEVIAWKSVDGTPVEGVLHKPANFQSGTRNALLIVIHGGPTGIFSREDFDFCPDLSFEGLFMKRSKFRGIKLCKDEVTVFKFLVPFH